MKSVLKWASLSLVVYCVFLIVKLPAVHVLTMVQLPKTISLSGISGTIWNGHARRVQANGLPIANLEWSVNFMPLLMGEVSADIKTGDIRDVEQISAKGYVSFSGSRLVVEDLLAYVPTDLVISMLPLPVPVQAGGRFKVELDQVEYAQGCQTFVGKGQWLNANFTGTTGVVNLSNFDADFSCDNSSVVVDIKEPNSFGLTAKVMIPANLKFNVSGRFKPDANLPAEVHQAAQFFGKTDANGYYPIKF